MIPFPLPTPNPVALGLVWKINCFYKEFIKVFTEYRSLTNQFRRVTPWTNVYATMNTILEEVIEEGTMQFA
jgi:hypothetical protein